MCQKGIGRSLAVNLKHKIATLLSHQNNCHLQVSRFAGYRVDKLGLNIQLKCLLQVIITIFRKKFLFEIIWPGYFL